MTGHHTVYRFHQATLDVQNVQLTVDGEPRPLEPKSFRLLQFLVENPGRVVTKEELLTAIWGETFVTDNAITRAITQVRKALADDSRQPRYIETVPTVGYRFMPTVTQNATDAPPIEPAARKFPLKWIALAAGVLATGIALFTITRIPGHKSAQIISSSQFTSSAGLDLCATFSSDGNLIAYASDRSGRFQIYVRSLEPGARELMITSSALQNFYPTFSPDSRNVAFNSLNDPGIFRVPALGGPVRRLTTFGAQPVWSPDGKWIVFRSEMTPGLSTTDLYFPALSALWLMRSDGSDLHQITSNVKPGGGQNFPTWNRDSSEVRFVNNRGAQAEMWAYRLSSNSLRKLFATSKPTNFGSAVFSKDDRSLFYITARLNGEIEIWQQRLNPADLSAVGEPTSLFAPSVGVPRDLSLSKDGDTLAFSAILSDSQILQLRLNPDGSAASQPEAITHDINFRYIHPRWQPDGKSISFIAMQKAKFPRVLLMTLPGGQPLEIDSDPGPQVFDLTTSSSKTIFYASGSPPVLKRFDPPDGIPQKVQQLPPGLASPDLAQNQSELAFHKRQDGQLQIWKMDLKTGESHQWTSGSLNRGYPKYSHDGRWIAFEQVEQGRSDLGLAPAQGPISDQPFERGIFYIHTWSPDDTKIAYAGFDQGVWNLYWVSRLTHEKRQLTQNQDARTYLRYPVWSPDGLKMAFERNESKGNIYLAKIH